MGYEQLQRNIQAFDRVVERLGFIIPAGAPVAGQLDLIKAFLTDMALSPEEAMKKTTGDHFIIWYRAMLAVNMLCEAVAEFEGLQDDALRNMIRLAVMTDISQDFEQSQSKNYLYEMQVGAWFHKAGFQVEFAEPDLRVSGNGLSQILGVACKYPSSEQRLNKNISKGYEQIARQSLRGFVAIAMDLLECHGMNRFVQFPDDLREVGNVIAGRLSARIKQSLENREKLPHQVPLDGAMFTLHMTAVWGRPAGLLPVTHITCQVDEANPIRKDLELLIESTNRTLRR